jgi:uncharacterized membrane protein YkvA (DUF1232 family)
MEQWQRRARQLKVDTYALYLAYRDPRTPWYARLFVACVVAYALSPLDLIPDFVPLLGYLDDLVLVPLGLALALRLIPPGVMVECRAQAAIALAPGKPTSRIGAAIVIAIWVLVAAIAIALLARRQFGG